MLVSELRDVLQAQCEAGRGDWDVSAGDLCLDAGSSDSIVATPAFDYYHPHGVYKHLRVMHEVILETKEEHDRALVQRALVQRATEGAADG